MHDSVAILLAASGWVFGFVTLYVTHFWSESRQVRDRRDELRLAFYLELLQWTTKHHTELPEIDESVFIAQYLDFGCRLQLLGSEKVREAYNAYFDLAIKELQGEEDEREPLNLLEVRDDLVAAMAAEFRRKSQLALGDRIRKLRKKSN
jgi:hypothetical protein